MSEHPAPNHDAAFPPAFAAPYADQFEQPVPAAVSSSPAPHRDRARRWIGPVALLAAGLLGGLGIGTVVTNASASATENSPGPSLTTDGSRSGVGGDDGNLDQGGGLTLDQLDGSPDGHRPDDGTAGGGHGHDRDGARSLSDGFTLIPGTQGTTGASG